MIKILTTSWKGISRKSKNYAVKLTAINRPTTNPRRIELKLLAIDSYIVILIISCLVIPIALSTPSSHIESLMLADIDTISWKRPKAKQMIDTAALKMSSKTILSLISSMKLFLSNTMMVSSLMKLSRLFLSTPL